MSATRMRGPPPGSWRLFAPALLTWACAAVAIVLPGTGWVLAALAGATGVTALLLCCGRARPVRACGHRMVRYGAVPCAVLLLLGVQIGFGERARDASGLAVTADGSRAAQLDISLRGFVQVQPSFGEPTAWAEARARTGSGTVPVVLWLSGDTAEQATSSARPWAPGARLDVTGEVVRLEAGSAAAYGVRVDRAELVAAAGEWADGTGAVIAWAGEAAARLRVGLAEAAAGVPGAALVPGFAVGDTSLVGPQLERQMHESSLSHLVAVSGANCALICGFALWVSGRLGAGRRTRIVIAAVLLGGFVFVVGPDASVQRAAVMAAVVLASGFGGKRAIALPALGAAVIVLLLVNPWQALQPGFALSVSATAGILLLVPEIERVLRRLLPVPRWAVLPVAVALAAQFACSPLLLFLQPGIPAVGVLANVIAGPAAPLGTGLGLVALFAIPLSPAAGQAVTVLASFPARWVSATAEVSASLPLARWAWPEGWPGALLLAGAEAALLTAWLVVSGRIRLPEDARAGRVPWRSAKRLSRRGRMAAAVLLCASAGVFSGPVVVSPLVERAAVPTDWSVVACDVGQGDALLLRDPEHRGEVMLVDTGDDPELLRGCLTRFGVHRVALLVLTHDDRDHVGALEAVSGKTAAALVAPDNAEDGDHRPVLLELSEAGVSYEMGVAGAHGTGAGLRWWVLAPEPGRIPRDTNAASLVLRVEIGELSVLLLADTGEKEHRVLLHADADLSATIAKVAHHGSRDQDPRLAAEIGAEYALVSVGADNSYGHPTAEALDAYAAAGSPPLRTDELGSIAISGSPGELRIWAERESGDVGGAE